MSFREIRPEEISDNIFKLIGSDWMLLTAGDRDAFNTMTASWGMAGVLWNKPVAQVFVRPQRFTYGFIEKSGVFTCSFFSEAYRPALALCGRVSGRDCDKVAEAGLTPVFDEDGVYFAEARLVLSCRKLYAQKIDRNAFCDDPTELSVYPNRDYHTAYIGEIVRCRIQEG